MNNYINYIITILLIIILFRYIMRLEKFTAVDDLVTIKNKFNTTVESNNLYVNDLCCNKITINGNLNANVLNILPKGSIIAWNTSIIPSGWILCDGSNNTPDLRGRFLIGSGQGNNLTNYNHKATGGEERVTLTLNQIPSHTHEFKYANWGGTQYTPATWGKEVDYTQGWDARDWGDTNTYEKETRGQSHENMPPYFTVFWIMKI